MCFRVPASLSHHLWKQLLTQRGFAGLTRTNQRYTAILFNQSRLEKLDN